MRAALIAVAALGFATLAQAEPLAPGMLDFDIVEGSVRQEPCVSAFYGAPTENVVCVEYARSDSLRLVAAYRAAIRSSGWEAHQSVYADAYYTWYSRSEGDASCTTLHHNFGPRESNEDWIAAHAPDASTNEAIHRALTDPDRRFTMLFRFRPDSACGEPDPDAAPSGGDKP